MTQVTLLIAKDNRIKPIKPRILGSADVTFHGKFYITVQRQDYHLEFQPIYSVNYDRVFLVCSELTENEEVNNYGEPDCILVTNTDKLQKLLNEEPKKYKKYDWDYTPFIETDDDRLLFLISTDNLSDDTKNIIPDEVGLSTATYLKESGNKSIWKDGNPLYRIN